MRAHAIRIGLFVLFGLLLRGFHYFRDPVIWQDEAAVIANVLEKDYHSLLGPLRLHQAAPPLFLWLEKLASDLGGDDAFALRLPPFLVSVVSLLLIVPIARKLLAPSAAEWAVLLFACSESLCRHACEVKPYSFDVFASTAIVAAYLARERVGLTAFLLLTGCLAPVLQWLSYPACFLHGGLIAALLPAVWRDRRLSTRAAFGFLVAMVGLAFGILLLGPAGSQRGDAALAHYWTMYYPDWSRPWTVPYWATHATLHVGFYACKPIGQFVMVLAGAGAVQFWNGGRRKALALLGVPIALALLASFLHRYPYGGFRLMVFATPGVIVLAAAAVPSICARLQTRTGLLAAGALAILLVPAGNAVKFVVQPWQYADTRSAADYVLTHRRAEDPVFGNDWTHIYYFRPIGDRFHEGDIPSPPPGDRVWIVWTETADAATRRHRIETLAPAGWKAVDRFESLHTTAWLFSRID